MSMTFSGSGTITGLVAGGLPDAVVTSSDLAANAVDSQALTLFNASGSAPVYACRAWVNFNGTGTVAIRASGNVSSITDNGTGDYTVNFATAMPDTNYCASIVGNGPTISDYSNCMTGPVYNLTSSVIRVINVAAHTATTRDVLYGYVAIFR
mgnify:CR=1 FL=1